jgi:hypothetical protein
MVVEVDAPGKGGVGGGGGATKRLARCVGRVAGYAAGRDWPGGLGRISSFAGRRLQGTQQAVTSAQRTSLQQLAWCATGGL